MIDVFIALIGTAAALLTVIIGILLIWLPEEYKHVLLQSFGTCILVFFACWLLTPSDSEFDQED